MSGVPRGCQFAAFPPPSRSPPPNRRARRRRPEGGRIPAALEHGSSREGWVMSNGWIVPKDVAANLIARPDIQAVGDTLFSNTKSQSWEYLKPQKEENNHG